MSRIVIVSNRVPLPSGNAGQLRTSVNTFTFRCPLSLGTSRVESTAAKMPSADKSSTRRRSVTDVVAVGTSG